MTRKSSARTSSPAFAFPPPLLGRKKLRDREAAREQEDGSSGGGASKWSTAPISMTLEMGGAGFGGEASTSAESSEGGGWSTAPILGGSAVRPMPLLGLNENDTAKPSSSSSSSSSLAESLHRNGVSKAINKGKKLSRKAKQRKEAKTAKALAFSEQTAKKATTREKAKQRKEKWKNLWT